MTDHRHDQVEVTKVKDLEPGDTVAYGTLLGWVTAAEDLTVKSVVPAAKNYFAVTFHRVGTLFLQGDMTVVLNSPDNSFERSTSR